MSLGRSAGLHSGNTGRGAMTSFEPELVHAEPVTTAVVRAVVPVGELRDFFDVSYREIARATGEQGVPIQGPAFALFRGAFGETADLEVGFPVEGSVRSDGDVVAGALPTGRVARVTHVGGF